MAAPKGNQYAVGNSGGAPCKYDLEQESRELLEFSLRPDATSIYQFVNPKDYSVTSLRDFCNQSKVFSQAYSKAKERIGLNRERLLHDSKFNETVYKKSSGIYDPLMHEYEEDLRDNEARRRQSTQVPFTNEQLTAFAALSNQLLQNQKKE